MKVGIPRGLLYYSYYPFLEAFFSELGAEIVVSPNTNKKILDEGVKYCVDEACFPVKIFHGHVSYIKNLCDAILIPRIMRIRKGEFICPKFCGLPEMVCNSIDDLPDIISCSLYATSRADLYNWARSSARMITKDEGRIKEAFDRAMLEQSNYKVGVNNQDFSIKIALAGHPYNIYDSYINMNVIKKLNKLGVGVFTEEFIDEEEIDKEVEILFKKPFWTFARNNYGFLSHVASRKKANGIIYISSFACGIDSVVVELIRDRIGEFPFLVLKIDEHTGEAGLDTRIEAFVDMLERRI